MTTTINASSYEKIYVGGEWVSSSGRDRIEVVSPWTEEVIASVPSATVMDVDRAVAAARCAFDAGEWRRTGLGDRLSFLRRVGSEILKRRKELATLTTHESGCPITQADSSQIASALALTEAYIAVAETYPFTSRRTSSTGAALVVREPVGVVAGVVPWNIPLTACLQKVLPALITGCTVVLKAAPQTPLSAFALTEMFAEAGLPPGVLNLIPAEPSVSEYLVGHPDVDKVGFTGSTGVGRRIASICGPNMKRMTLELGGKSAALISDDADLDHAVESLRMGSLRNSGQICSLKTRILVSERRHDELVERLVAMVRTMRVDDPYDDETQIGPLVTASQRDRVNGYISLGQSEGAIPLKAAGNSIPGHGWFVEPTIFTGVTAEMRIAQEEIFGPVLAIMKYRNEDDAVALANESPFGLNGAIFTNDLERGLDLGTRIRTGTIEINGCTAGFHAPAGGVKQSGIGREVGPEGLDSYCEPKAYGISTDLLKVADDHFARP